MTTETKKAELLSEIVVVLIDHGRSHLRASDRLVALLADRDELEGLTAGDLADVLAPVLSRIAESGKRVLRKAEEVQAVVDQL